MAEDPKTGKGQQADDRRARLAAQLRSNLKKRKEQARRAQADAPSAGRSQETNKETGKERP